MTPRERVLTAMNHKKPDRVPLALGGVVSSITQPAYINLKKHLGFEWVGEEYNWLDVMDTFDERILNLFGIDFRYVSLKNPDNWTDIKHSDGSVEGEWGLRYRKVGFYNEWIWYRPLENATTVNDIESHRWPDLEASGRTKGLKAEARKFQQEGWATAASPISGGIFEISWWVRGFERFMEDLLIRPSFACAIMDKVLDVYLGLFDQYLQAVGDYVDLVMFCDDVSGQSGMMISPDLYRKYLKPRHRRLFDFIRSKTSAKIFIHICGSCEPIIPDLIEIGVDILNPVQPLAKDMDSLALKKKYGRELTFYGGIDEQKVLPYGTPEDVEKELIRRIEAFRGDGGYILSSAHNIQPDVPPENIVKLYEAAQKHGFSGKETK